mmetsp:Transcript_22694/g.70266  ORF Transcript_22694/g.70266 Transcript_22694/m.70266 type:complete len:379 (+) Transcript_22694:241-1377(+)
MHRRLPGVVAAVAPVAPPRLPAQHVHGDTRGGRPDAAAKVHVHEHLAGDLAVLVDDVVPVAAARRRQRRELAAAVATAAAEKAPAALRQDQDGHKDRRDGDDGYARDEAAVLVAPALRRRLAVLTRPVRLRRHARVRDGDAPEATHLLSLLVAEPEAAGARDHHVREAVARDGDIVEVRRIRQARPLEFGPVLAGVLTDPDVAVVPLGAHGEHVAAVAAHGDAAPELALAGDGPLRLPVGVPLAADPDVAVTCHGGDVVAVPVHPDALPAPARGRLALRVLLREVFAAVGALPELPRVAVAGDDDAALLGDLHVGPVDLLASGPRLPGVARVVGDPDVLLLGIRILGGGDDNRLAIDSDGAPRRRAVRRRRLVLPGLA